MNSHHYDGVGWFDSSRAEASTGPARMFEHQAAATAAAREGLPEEPELIAMVIATRARLKARHAELTRFRDDYLRHLQCRIDDGDRHGMWDCSINIAETEAGLFEVTEAAKALGLQEPFNS